jgi:uncharacterized membrane protein YdcZ (DUF606 family)
MKKEHIMASILILALISFGVGAYFFIMQLATKGETTETNETTVPTPFEYISTGMGQGFGAVFPK